MKFFIDMLNLIRSMAYGMVAVEAFILAFIYYFGYEKVKHTPIIKSIVAFFFSLGLFFIFATYNTAADFFDSPLHDVIKLFGTLFVTPLIISLTYFRRITMEDTKTNTEKIIINTIDIIKNTKDIKENTSDIAKNTKQAGINVSNIDTNTTDININTEKIQSDSDRIDVLEEGVKK